MCLGKRNANQGGRGGGRRASRASRRSKKRSNCVTPSAVEPFHGPRPPPGRLVVDPKMIADLPSGSVQSIRLPAGGLEPLENSNVFKWDRLRNQKSLQTLEQSLETFRQSIEKQRQRRAPPPPRPSPRRQASSRTSRKGRSPGRQEHPREPPSRVLSTIESAVSENEEPRSQVGGGRGRASRSPRHKSRDIGLPPRASPQTPMNKGATSPSAQVYSATSGNGATGQARKRSPGNGKPPSKFDSHNSSALEGSDWTGKYFSDHLSEK